MRNSARLWKTESRISRRTPSCGRSTKADATRGTSSTVLNRLAKLIPNLIGGSADLGPSNKSRMKERGDFLPEDRTGSNLHFGIREHAMAAIANGICLHGGLTVYCATFFVFSDYMKNAMRLSALMNLPVIYILTHDSIGVGEDGPTHEPGRTARGAAQHPKHEGLPPLRRQGNRRGRGSPR